MASKVADLAGPGIGDYAELERILPSDYHSLLDRKDTQRAIFEVKQFIEEELCRELNLLMVTVPLVVDVESGVNDMLDRDGSRTPIQFHISNDRDLHPLDAQIWVPDMNVVDRCKTTSDWRNTSARVAAILAPFAV